MNRIALEAAPPQTTPIRLFVIEGILSIGQNLLMAGIFFYTRRRLEWNVTANLLLAAGEGLFYTAGALLANRAARQLGRRPALIGLCLLMAAMSMLALLTRLSSWLAAAVLMYTFVMAMAWPMLESLVSSGLDAHALSRRIGTYNLIWAGVGAASIAIEGAIIDYFPIGVCLVPLIVNLLSAVLMWGVNEPEDSPAAEPHLKPEPGSMRKRRLALWLSRIALPVTYLVQYSFLAMMPSLPVFRPLSTTLQTVIGSVWMGGRLGMFWLLGISTWWHTRPRVLLWAVVVMGVSFFGVTLRPSAVLGIAAAADLPSMVFWQVLLGAAFGIIYCASLYFGMVLSQGSTEHGGYHEALIGLGIVLGPGFAALASAFWPGRVNASIGVIGVMIALSIAAAGGVTLKHGSAK